jgi:hypothetical protein
MNIPSVLDLQQSRIGNTLLVYITVPARRDVHGDWTPADRDAEDTIRLMWAVRYCQTTNQRIPF